MVDSLEGDCNKIEVEWNNDHIIYSFYPLETSRTGHSVTVIVNSTRDIFKEHFMNKVTVHW